MCSRQSPRLLCRHGAIPKDPVTAVWRCGSTALACAFNSRMNKFFENKPKKSLKSFRRHISLGIAANVAVGPLGFQAELEGEQSSCYDLGTDGPDPTVVLDEEDAQASRVLLRENESEHRGLAAVETSASGLLIPAIVANVHADSCVSPRQKRTPVRPKRKKANQPWCRGVHVNTNVSFALNVGQFQGETTRTQSLEPPPFPPMSQRRPQTS